MNIISEYHKEYKNVKTHSFYSVAWEGVSLFWKRMAKKKKKVNGQNNWQNKKKIQNNYAVVSD